MRMRGEIVGMVFSSLLQQIIILVGEDEGDDDYNAIILIMDHFTIGVMIMTIMRVIFTQMYQQ